MNIKEISLEGCNDLLNQLILHTNSYFVIKEKLNKEQKPNLQVEEEEKFFKPIEEPEIINKKSSSSNMFENGEVEFKVNPA